MSEPSAVLRDAVTALERELTRWTVPAVEIAVVSTDHGEVVDALGVRGAEDPSPVSAGTLFHHGSCMKAVTSLVAALLAEDGVLDLDAQVRRYVPELRLPDPVLADRMTTRDLLSHRSGLGQHDLAWIWNPDLTDAQVLERVAALPLAADLRTGMHYSNFGYALVGQVIGRVTGASWAEQVQARVLDPCDMKLTVIDAFPAAGDTRDHAVGHLLVDGRAVPTPWRFLGAIGPAGQFVTCATDAARWLRLQLGLTGSPAISTDAVRTTHHAQIGFPPGASGHAELAWLGYGLGWVTGTFRSRPVVWHSGGIDGFLTNTLLLPEQQIGITVSASLHMSDLAFAAVLQIADELLGTAGERSWYDRLHGQDAHDTAAAPKPAPRPGGRSPSQPLSAFVGTYVDDGYGELTITATEDRLTARAGTADLFLSHRHFDTWDARYLPLDERFPLTFVTDADGVVAEVRAGLDVGAPVRFVRRPTAVVPTH